VKRMKKVLCSLVGVMLLLSVTLLPIEAYSTVEDTVIVLQKDDGLITINADVIVSVFRIYYDSVYPNGVVQVRRWNETRGYWVDPDWINIAY